MMFPFKILDARSIFGPPKLVGSSDFSNDLFIELLNPRMDTLHAA